MKINMDRRSRSLIRRLKAVCLGRPLTGSRGSVSFQLDNNLEMKIKSDRDSTGERKISLIDKLSLGMSYNMAADSFKWE